MDATTTDPPAYDLRQVQRVLRREIGELSDSIAHAHEAGVPRVTTRPARDRLVLLETIAGELEAYLASGDSEATRDRGLGEALLVRLRGLVREEVRQ